MEEVVKYKLANGDRVRIGTYIRDSEWQQDEKNCYIVGINNWIINSEGKFLVQRRALTKKNNPGKWSSTNGLIQLEENGVDTVQRETLEELGLKIKPDQIALFEKNHIAGEHLVVDIYVTHADPKLEDITVQENEVDKVCFVSLDELMTIDVSTTCSYIREQGAAILDYFSRQFNIKHK